ncbi:glycoside hydrolase family 71/99-like protein [Novipirellula artificiosorum]|uniref:glycoside hydrolase family 71/99-like protein n=1 Tax=Novipirellula artificiosorum TaxID=2528016 RepID=UPI0018CE7DE1|nr:glycoside hydrolase family 71/99-like protein [Novipirellula artificiosorum]
MKILTNPVSAFIPEFRPSLTRREPSISNFKAGKELPVVLLFILAVATNAVAQSGVGTGGSKHSPTSRFASYEGRILCGYQGWFRAAGDGSDGGWGHYGSRGRFDPDHCTIDIWPDVSEYETTYATDFKLEDGTPARVFSSRDASTVDVHFRWMKQYGIDGVFMQRFFGVTRSPRSRREGRIILGNALRSSQKHGRAISVMYDLSGLKPGEDCSSVIDDWKELVDEMKLTSQGEDQTYLYHRGKPLVAIWGIGFPDRPYDLREIGIEKLLDFLKKDPEYGGCSVMLGVPTYFRDLETDCVGDPYLHEVIEQADVIMPWMVQRFTSLLHNELERYGNHIQADLSWCKQRGVDYVPCAYPGFSWFNLSRHEFDGRHPLDQNPRQKGAFYWGLLSTAIQSGAPMIYVAMFDEVDEATAIFKCTDHPPQNQPPSRFLTNEGVPSDHYLWLTGKAAEVLRGERELDKNLYQETEH